MPKNKTAAIVCLVTVPETFQAHRMAKRLIDSRLAACINIVGKVESHFFWQGKVDHAREKLLVIKTERSKFDKLRRAIKSMHPYAVPEIIALDIVCGERSYIEWLRRSLAPSLFRARKPFGKSFDQTARKGERASARR